MLADLIAVLDGADEDEGWASIDEIRWSDADLHLSFSVQAAVEAQQSWSVVCYGVVDFRLSTSADEYIDHITDPEDPVLAPYHDQRATLYFNGSPEAPLQLLGDLWLTGRGLLGDGRSACPYIRDDLNQKTLLEAGHGEFARGPVFALEAYAAVLERYGITATVVGHHPFRRWNGVEWVSEAPYEALRLGDSVIVAKRFLAQPTPRP